MKFRVQGADAETGTEKTLILDCESAEIATLNANAQGIMVSSVGPVAEVTEPVHLPYERNALRPPQRVSEVSMSGVSPLLHSRTEPISAHTVEADGSKEPTKCFDCPNCGSDQTQKLSVLYSSGTVNVRETSQVRAKQYAFSSPIHDITIQGVISTGGIHQTKLAALVAPPAQPKLKPKVGRMIDAIILLTTIALFGIFLWELSKNDLCSGLVTGVFWSIGILIVSAIAIGKAKEIAESSARLSPEFVESYNRKSWIAGN
jgi:hypothetical protein